MKAFCIFLLGTIIMSGCAVQRAQVATRAQSEMIGKSKKDLLSCAGVPLRQERIDDLEFLTFAGGGDNVTTTMASRTSPSTAIAVGKSAHRYCEATFILKDDTIQRVNYHGRTGGLLTKGEQCAFIVENCVRQ